MIDFDIEQGTIRGTQHSGYIECLGIPYAEPPVGELRFRPPRKPIPWDGVRDGRSFGAASLQASTEYDPAQGSEDCLYLNVYKPTNHTANEPLPVMVWLHGGGFVNGSGNAFFSGLLAQTAQAIIVTVNYRLGPLGWLALLSLAAESDDHNAGNYGLLDNIAALSWVHTNIAAFGGDPDRVTVFGQSAGGEQVLALLASPPAEGLFHRAISMSAPAGLTLPDLSAAAAKRTEFLSELGCENGDDQLARLRRLSAQHIINAAHIGWDLIKNGLAWTPTVGGPVLPTQWVDLFRQGKFHHVPVMIGHTKQEARLLTAIHENNIGHALTKEEGRELLRGFFPEDVDKISHEYGLDSTDEPSTVVSAIVTDSLWVTGLEKCRIALTRGTKLFNYQTFDPDAPESHVHAEFSTIAGGHDSDLPALFQWDDFGSEPPTFTAEQQKLAVQLGRYWGKFAATGNPNGPGLPQWPSMDQQHIQYLETDHTGGTRATPNSDYYQEHHVEFWSPLVHPEPDQG